MRLTEKEKSIIRGEIYHFVHDQLNYLYGELQEIDDVPSAIDKIVTKIEMQRDVYTEKRIKIDRYAVKYIDKVFNEIYEILKSKKEFMELMLKKDK